MLSNKEKIEEQIQNSEYLSRDLSWTYFNERVLDQARKPGRNIFEKLKFMAISASNLDEFFMIRIGSLYNYLDYGKERLDYSGLWISAFKEHLYDQIHSFVKEQQEHFKKNLEPQFTKNGFRIVKTDVLDALEKKEVNSYFKKTLFPMLTPMVYDNYHTFPVLMNKILVFGIITKDDNDSRKISFLQIPQNIPRFYTIERHDEILFVPIEEIIRNNIQKLFRNIKILTINLFRITRNGDFTLDESDDVEVDFIDEIKQKIKTRKTGRVVRIETEIGCSKGLKRLVKSRWKIDDQNIFETDSLIDLTALWQIVGHTRFQTKLPKAPSSVLPFALRDTNNESIFQVLRKRDVFLHHPYNSMDTLLMMIEEAAKDPFVLAIKITIYRVAKNSRITRALLVAAENGKNVSVLFELKARFDEENNIEEAIKLQKAGCFVIYGKGNLKTHTKMLLIVRKEEQKVTRYVHISSGNYNEKTAKLYTDIGLLSANEIYGRDVSEFFNVITGHSNPEGYEQLLTAPQYIRKRLIELIEAEAQNAKNDLPSGIVFKINSLQDKQLIKSLYQASQAGVPVKLIIRGICCLRPQREGLSENISVISIVGDYLEHSRLFYFQNNNDPKIYGGSADAMVRSFDRRIESLFLFLNERCKKEAMYVLAANLKDNVNAYILKEDGTYIAKKIKKDDAVFNLHKEFYLLDKKTIDSCNLYDHFLAQKRLI